MQRRKEDVTLLCCFFLSYDCWQHIHKPKFTIKYPQTDTIQYRIQIVCIHLANLPTSITSGLKRENEQRGGNRDISNTNQFNHQMREVNANGSRKIRNV